MSHIAEKPAEKAVIKKIREIFQLQLKIPDYQRPYKWETRHAGQLFDDLLNHYNQSLPYRVGTIVIHDQDGINNIVDGQQRLITLSLLLHALDYEGHSLLGETIKHSISVTNIRRNYLQLESLVSQNNVDGLENYILHECEMVVVRLTDMDEAFQFFDSQNARGKPLEAYDLLKAYHLREMQGKSEEVINNSVENWEKAALAKEEDPNLFRVINHTLFRLRQWQHQASAENFTSQHLDVFKGISENEFFPYMYANRLAYLHSRSLILPSASNRRNGFAGFQATAPIINGEWFFVYIEYYKYLYKILFSEHGILNQIREVDGVVIEGGLAKYLINYKGRRHIGFRFLRNLFEIAVLSYYDKFGDNNEDKPGHISSIFHQFIIKAFRWVFRLLIHYKSIGYPTVENEAISGDGLLKHIEHSISPKDVLRFSEKLFSKNADPVDDVMKKIFIGTKNHD